MTANSGVYFFKDLKVVPDTFGVAPLDSSNGIIIDNGSYQCRMGWNFVNSPSLIYKNILARTRKEKGKDSELQVGNDISNYESVRHALKSPFDRNVVTQFETMESLLDYGFSHLGITNESSIPNPICMTHPLANPNRSQSLMNELLFECYSVPKVCYAVDALCSLHENQTIEQSSNVLVISFGYQTVHFIPILEGKVRLEGIRRLNLGGYQLINYLQKSLQLKYPGHINNISLCRTEEMLHDHVFVARHFQESLRSMQESEDYYLQHVHKIQLPYVPVPKIAPPDPEILKLRRQELAKRLVEINARKREEKLAEDETLLKTLKSAQNLLEQGYNDKAKRILGKIGVLLPELKALIFKTSGRIEKRKMGKSSKVKEEPHLEKHEGESEPKKRREDMEENERQDFDLWLNDIRNKRTELLEKRAARILRKQQLAKRRTAASQERMRMINQLAKISKKEDTFGMKDEDWDVYKKINKDVGDSDSEEEQEKLLEFEKVLKEHDPHFGIPEQREIPHDSYEWHQLHLCTERIRVSEILFQPSIIGHDQAGVSEIIEFILKLFTESEQQKLINNVFLCGALSGLQGLKERIESDIRVFRPFQSQFYVSKASNGSLDPWSGARKLSFNDSFYMSKADYSECGSEYFKQHSHSNIYFKTPNKLRDD